MTTFGLAHAEIVHERVDDEVIAINLRTGAYFSLVGSAADAWDLLVARHDAAATATALASRYQVVDARVVEDLVPFLASLIEEDLLGEAPGDQVDTAQLPPLAPGSVYRAPVLEKYDDMEELLLLDPIHEVDAAGWPALATEPIDS